MIFRASNFHKQSRLSKLFKLLRELQCFLHMGQEGQWEIERLPEGRAKNYKVPLPRARVVSSVTSAQQDFNIATDQRSWVSPVLSEWDGLLQLLQPSLTTVCWMHEGNISCLFSSQVSRSKGTTSRLDYRYFQVSEFVTYARTFRTFIQGRINVFWVHK